MPFVSVIFSSLETPADTLGVTVASTTSVPQHLMLTYSHFYPVKTPRFITRYGRTRECGFYLQWHAYITLDQAEPGDSLTHTYRVPIPESLASAWGALAPSSPPIPGQPATAPFPIPRASQGTPRLDLLRLSSFSVLAGNQVYVPMELVTIQNLWPAPPPPLPTPYINSPPGWTIQAQAECGIDCPADVPITIELTDQSGTTVYQTLTPVNHSGTEWGYTTIGAPPQPGGSTFALRVHNTSPLPVTVGLFQRTPQLNAFGY